MHVYHSKLAGRQPSTLIGNAMGLRGSMWEVEGGEQRAIG